MIITKPIKTKICLLLCVVLLCVSLTSAVEALSLSAQSAVLLEASSGKLVFGKNENTKRGMASTTKIMTALVAVENSDLSDIVEIDDRSVGIEGSSIYLKKGEKLTMESLLNALLLQSANDAATAIALKIGGSVEGFADMMNDRAKKMGLTNTHFTNPHGLYDDDHYTTAYELALIAREALKNDVIKEIVARKSYAIPQNEISQERYITNHNKLLWRYDGCIGVKTGFTKQCGRCLVSAAKKDGVCFIAVTLNAPDDWVDHKKMLDYGFSLYRDNE